MNLFMWVAKEYKSDSWYCLWNRKPRKVSEQECARDIQFGFREKEYTSWHGKINIPEEYSSMFDGLEFPVEVELVRDDSDSPMFYAQKIIDSSGKGQVYISTCLEYRYHPVIKKKFGPFVISKEIDPTWWVSTKCPEEDVIDLSVNVSTTSMMIRPKDFNWDVKDGYIPVKLKIK